MFIGSINFKWRWEHYHLEPNAGDSGASFAPTVVQTVGMASKMERLEEETHSKSSSFLDQSKVKLTPKGVSVQPDSVEYLLMHVLNPPTVDGALTVNTVFHMLEDKCISYQLKHNDAFYSQNQRVLRLVLRDSENISSWSDEYIRVNHREFSRRLAHWYFHWRNYTTMWLAAAANLCILGHVKGKGKYHDTGEAFKLGRVNNALTRLGAYFLPKNLLKCIVDNSKYGTGQVVSGAYAFSVPYWNATPVASPSRNTVKVSDLIPAVSKDTHTIKRIQVGAEDSDALLEFERNLDRVRREFVRDDIVKDSNNVLHHANFIADRLDKGQDKDVNVVPSTWYIENGDVLSLDNGNGASFNLGANSSLLYKSKNRQKVGDASYVTTDNLINRVWDTFDYYMEAMETYFSEMANQTSPVVRFWADLGLLDMPIPSSKFWNSFDTKNTTTLDSLREQRVYKKDNRPAAAGQIKWTPIFDTYESTWKGDDFDANFNRYPVDGSDDVATARSSDRYPTNNPVIFHDVTLDTDGEDEPFVVNVGQSGSTQSLPATVTGVKPVHGIQGKYAAMLDYLSSSVFDYLRTSVAFIGANKDDVEAFMNSGDGYVYRETLTEVHDLFYPLIDTSDPYQCGFYMVVYCNSSDRTEHELFYMDRSKIVKQSSAGSNTPDKFTALNGAPDIPMATAWKYDTSDSTFVRPHICNKDYLDRQRYCFVFVGDSIWYHPELTQFLKGAGNPTEYYGEAAAADGPLHTLYHEVNNYVASAASSSNGKGSIDFDSSNKSMEQIISAALLGDVTVSKADIKSGYSNTTLAMGAIGSQDNVNNVLEIMHVGFNPSYGPMLPIIYGMPDIGQSDLLWHMNKSGNAGIEAGDIQPMSGIKMIGAEGDSAGTGAIDWQVLISMEYDPSYQMARSVNQFFLWFIDDMNITKVYRRGSRLYSPEEKVALTGFSGLGKVSLALLSRGRVEHLGAEDSEYFNNIKVNLNEIESYEYEASEPVNFGAILADPRVQQTEYKAKVHFKVRGKLNRNFNTQAAQSDNSEKEAYNGKEACKSERTNQTGKSGSGESGSGREDRKPGKGGAGSKTFKKGKERVRGDDSTSGETASSGSDKNTDGKFGADFQPSSAKPEKVNEALASQSASS